MSNLDFEFTDDLDLHKSSLVEGVYFNRNEGYAVVDLNDSMYRYDNVSYDDVAELANSHSHGWYYNTQFKVKHGPGVYLGEWDDLEFDEVSVQAPVKKIVDVQPVANDWSATPEFSLNIDPANDLVSVPVSKEYSLQTPPKVEVANEKSDVTSTVRFTLDGHDKVYEFVSTRLTVEGAISEVNDYVRRLGAKGAVKSVTFDFE